MLNNQIALLAIDFQVDFLHADGRFPVAQHQVEPMLTAANHLIAAARSYHTPVIYIGNEYGSRNLLNVFRNNAALKGSSGMQIDSRLLYANDHYFPKDQSSAFTNSQLDLFLRQQTIKHLLLTGVYATACVRKTALDGLKYGYQVSLMSDAVADKNDQRRNAALKELERKGICILTSTDWLEEMSKATTSVM
ncbi:MAG: cysteine hydrolase [Anaerolineae bacterium]|nr:cysteine hydrolase [Anaerolineae bacterium]